MGCDKAAELALKILARKEESDAVKHWALRTLGNLFAIEPESANKDVSVFAYHKSRESRDLENKCIVALCEYILTPRDVANMSKEEVGGVTMIRREAVKALGMVRTPRLKYEGKVMARPALVLLKVANKDGIVPEPDLHEQVEAIIGFCQLFPVVRANADRDVQCDLAAFGLGSAILKVVELKINTGTDISIPWKQTGRRLEFALDNWAKNVEAMHLNSTVAVAGALAAQFKSDLFQWLSTGDQSTPPNSVGFRQWLQQNPPKATTLFADEPGATMKVVGN
jgi:hypothetical protein